MDFMFIHLKLNRSLFNRKEKLLLVEAALIQLFKKDNSLSRRIHTWLFGKPNMDNQYEIN